MKAFLNIINHIVFNYQGIDKSNQYCPKRLRILIQAYVSVHPEAYIVEFRNSIPRMFVYAPMGAFGG